MSTINKILTKASYPIFGNLSKTIQRKIQYKTDYDYKGEKATKVSSFTNLLIAYNADKILNLLPSALSSSISTDFPPAFFIYTLFESIYRYNKATDRNTMFTEFELGKPTGSLIGKLLSLPIEAYLYWKDDVSEYTKQRIMEKVNFH